MSFFRSVSRSVSLVVACLALSAGAYAQQKPTPAIQQVIARIVTRETEEMQTIRKYSPIVETYIQRAKTNEDKIWAPDGDHTSSAAPILARVSPSTPWTRATPVFLAASSAK